MDIFHAVSSCRDVWLCIFWDYCGQFGVFLSVLKYTNLCIGDGTALCFVRFRFTRCEFIGFNIITSLWLFTVFWKVHILCVYCLHLGVLVVALLWYWFELLDYFLFLYLIRFDLFFTFLWWLHSYHRKGLWRLMIFYASSDIFIILDFNSTVLFRPISQIHLFCFKIETIVSTEMSTGKF